MLGFSLPKLLLLIILIAVIWYGFKYMARLDAVRRAVRDEFLRQQQARRRPKLEAEDLVKCMRCGAYVAAQGAAACGRADCPWGK